MSLQGRVAWLSGLAASGAMICQLSPLDCRSLGEAGQEAVGLLEGPALEGSVLQLSGWCQGSGWCQMKSHQQGIGEAGEEWWWFDSAVRERW